MLLVIDVGNTNIVLGAYQKDRLMKSWRISTMHNRSADEMGMMMIQLLAYEKIEIEAIEAVILSSVVPPVMFSLERAIKRYLKRLPVVVDSSTDTGIRILYDNPKEVGADRIVNAVAAHHEYHCNLIIIDFGTATTFCSVTKDAEYLGGVICPGIRISLDALFEHTAKLPKIELSKPATVIGKNTVHSMQSGMLFGYTGQVDYIVRRMKAEMGGGEIKVVATGGMATLISDISEEIDVVDGNLTLNGLKLIYERTVDTKREKDH